MRLFLFLLCFGVIQGLDSKDSPCVHEEYLTDKVTTVKSGHCWKVISPRKKFYHDEAIRRCRNMHGKPVAIDTREKARLASEFLNATRIAYGMESKTIWLSDVANKTWVSTGRKVFPNLLTSKGRRCVIFNTTVHHWQYRSCQRWQKRPVLCEERQTKDNEDSKRFSKEILVEKSITSSPKPKRMPGRSRAPIEDEDPVPQKSILIHKPDNFDEDRVPQKSILIHRPDNIEDANILVQKVRTIEKAINKKPKSTIPPVTNTLIDKGKGNIEEEKEPDYGDEGYDDYEEEHEDYSEHDDPAYVEEQEQHYEEAHENKPAKKGKSKKRPDAKTPMEDEDPVPQKSILIHKPPDNFDEDRVPQKSILIHRPDNIEDANILVQKVRAIEKAINKKPKSTIPPVTNTLIDEDRVPQKSILIHRPDNIEDTNILVQKVRAIEKAINKKPKSTIPPVTNTLIDEDRVPQKSILIHRPDNIEDTNILVQKLRAIEKAINKKPKSTIPPVTNTLIENKPAKKGKSKKRPDAKTPIEHEDYSEHDDPAYVEEQEQHYEEAHENKPAKKGKSKKRPDAKTPMGKGKKNIEKEKKTDHEDDGYGDYEEEHEDYTEDDEPAYVEEEEHDYEEETHENKATKKKGKSKKQPCVKTPIENKPTKKGKSKKRPDAKMPMGKGNKNIEKEKEPDYEDEGYGDYEEEHEDYTEDDEPEEEEEDYEEEAHENKPTKKGKSKTRPAAKTPIGKGKKNTKEEQESDYEEEMYGDSEEEDDDYTEDEDEPAYVE